MYSNIIKEVHENQRKEIHVQQETEKKNRNMKRFSGTWKKNFLPEKLEKDNHTIISCTKYKG